jgi:hypothetical protein
MVNQNQDKERSRSKNISNSFVKVKSLYFLFIFKFFHKVDRTIGKNLTKDRSSSRNANRFPSESISKLTVTKKVSTAQTSTNDQEEIEQEPITPPSKIFTNKREIA